jgi:hypothetical protein
MNIYRFYDYIKQNPNKIDWKEMSDKPHAVDFLQKFPEYIDWNYFSLNRNAFPILKQNPDKIVWKYFSANRNPEAIEMLAQNLDKIDWFSLCMNYSPEAMKLLEKNIHKITELDEIEKRHHRRVLSANCCAVELLEKYPELIDWNALCKNINPRAIYLLYNNPDRINWEIFLRNHDFYLFECDYKELKKARKTLNVEIIRAAMHPRRVARYLEMGGDLDDF